MVAWVVINRQRTRQSPPSFFPRSHSHFGSHASLISEKTTPFVSYTYVEPILQPFCFQILACNGGSVLPSGSRLPIAYPLSSTCPEQSRGIPFLFTLLRTLLHFFAFSCTCQKLNSFLFNRFRTLCAKHPGWGVLLPRACPAGITASLRAIEKKLNCVTLDEGEMGG